MEIHSIEGLEQAAGVRIISGRPSTCHGMQGIFLTKTFGANFYDDADMKGLAADYENGLSGWLFLEDFSSEYGVIRGVVLERTDFRGALLEWEQDRPLERFDL